MLLAKQDFALQMKAVATLNDKAVGQPRKYPNPIGALKTASMMRPDTAAAATSTLRHLLDTYIIDEDILALQPPYTAPINVLLLTSGFPFGVVADIMDVTMLHKWVLPACFSCL